MGLCQPQLCQERLQPEGDVVARLIITHGTHRRIFRQPPTVDADTPQAAGCEPWFRVRAVDAVTFVVAAGVGLDVGGETIAYVAGWGEDGALGAVTQFAETVDAVACRIEDALVVDAPVSQSCGAPDRT